MGFFQFCALCRREITILTSYCSFAFINLSIAENRSYFVEKLTSKHPFSVSNTAVPIPFGMPKTLAITGFPVSTFSVSVSRAKALSHQCLAHFLLSAKEYSGKRKKGKGDR